MKTNDISPVQASVLKRIFVVSICVIFLVTFSRSAPTLARGSHHAPKDDLFGMHYDSDKVPSSSTGIGVTYYDSTAGVTLVSGYTGWCTLVPGSGAGSIGTVATVHTSGGYVLQGGPTLVKNASSQNTWFFGWGYFDNAVPAHWYCGTLKALSASTYTSLSGTEKIYYTGSVWKLEVYVSQTGSTYSYTFPSNIGTTVDGSSNDWNANETTYTQTGVTLTSSFTWEIEYPLFLVSGSWQNWNTQGINWKALDVYATVQPSGGNPNNIGVAWMSTPGVYVQIGQSALDGDPKRWCESGSCPSVPPP